MFAVTTVESGVRALELLGLGKEEVSSSKVKYFFFFNLLFFTF